MPIDPATAVTAIQTTWEVGKGAYVGWRWYERWRMGTVSIHTPKNNKSIPPGDVDFEGTHKDARGIYWLIGFRRDEYWPKCRVDLKPDGTWNEWVSIGDHPGPREAITGLFWVSQFASDMLYEVKSRCDKLGKWEPIRVHPPRGQMRLVQGIVLSVTKPIG